MVCVCGVSIMDSEINRKIIACGREMFSEMEGETPSIFNKGRWLGKVMAWSMSDEKFKNQLFRFVDVFPSLSSDKQIIGHLKAYFADPSQPAAVSLLSSIADRFGPVGNYLSSKGLSSIIKHMASQFIVGAHTSEAVRNVEYLRDQGFCAVVDVLGEAILSEKEADAYVDQYLQLIDALDRASSRWKPLGWEGSLRLDWGHAPFINVSVKVSALYCLASPLNFEGSVGAVLNRLYVICDRVVQSHGFLCLDMESYRLKEIVLEVFRRLRLRYRDYPYLGVVLQSYLKDTDEDLENLLDWAREEKVFVSVRLVKGAYWDYEVVKARQSHLPVPVWERKTETDAAFERQARRILENHAICHFACASHNIRSIAAVIEHARELQVPEERYEFQMLYGMAEPVRRAVLKRSGRVRLYCPYGPMVPGMGYLVRRLLENTANVSFLRQAYLSAARGEALLQDPVQVLEREKLAAPSHNLKKSGQQGRVSPFRNEPIIDFTSKGHRQAFQSQIAAVRRQCWKIYPLYINGVEQVSENKIASINPADPAEVIGWVCQAGIPEVSQAIDAAGAAFEFWRETAIEERAAYLFKTAIIVRRRIFELAAWQVLEIGKQWDQAYADVAEAIDFLEYYAREMLRLGQPLQLGHLPGESNYYFYEPKGVAAVIAPWNFPLAISMGMISASIVTGNCVVFKPSGLTPVLGWMLVEVFREAGLPHGVLNFIPGSSAIIGDFLVDHPGISLIAFTGSLGVGLRIIERAATVQPGQAQVKKVICEMGGKNAIIIDEDADLDEAVPNVLFSAFGFQGQKCSACSRVIVLDSIYEKFVERITLMAEAVSVGPAEDPANLVGALAEQEAQSRVLEYIRIGCQEGRLLFRGMVPPAGFFVPIAIIGDIRPEHRLAQEEIFGPVLSLMKAKDFNEALCWANSSPYALTGGVFSRSPENIALAVKKFRVGNLYLNRNCTGAAVGRQPFGGFKMSGMGTKAGGHDYLIQFMDSRVVTENTMRRGFAPSVQSKASSRKSR